MIHLPLRITGVFKEGEDLLAVFGSLGVELDAANEPYPDGKAQAFPFRRQWR